MDARNLVNIIENVIPKHVTQMRKFKINGCWLGPKNSINIVPDNKATQMAIKRIPNDLLTNTVSVSLFNIAN